MLLNFESGFYQVDNCLTLSSAERESLHDHGQAQSTTDAREQELWTALSMPQARFRVQAPRLGSSQWSEVRGQKSDWKSIRRFRRLRRFNKQQSLVVVYPPSELDVLF